MTSFVLIRYWPGSSGRSLANTLMALTDSARQPLHQGHGHANTLYMANNYGQLDAGQIAQDPNYFAKNFVWDQDQQLAVIDSHWAESAVHIMQHLKQLGPAQCVDIVFGPQDARQINYNFVRKAVARDTLGVCTDFVQNMWKWAQTQYPEEYSEFQKDDWQWQADLITRMNTARTWLDSLTNYPDRRTIHYSKIRQGLTREDLMQLVNGLDIKEPLWDHALELSRIYARDQHLYTLAT
jgi:hypothetical protein